MMMDVICDVMSDVGSSQQLDERHEREVGVRAAPAPVSVVRLSSRCVLLTYFDGDVASSVDQHFTRSLAEAATRCCYDSKYAVNSLHGWTIYD